MSCDGKSYDFAKVWLEAYGYTWTGDIDKLAQAIQDTAEDFVAGLEKAVDQ